MSTGWTAPGSSEGTPQREPEKAAHGPAPQPDGQRGGGPRRELISQVPLFPLRPLTVGEVLGAAVRIYRMRPKPVLALSAAVYGLAFALITLITGAGMIPMIGQMQAVLDDPTGEELAPLGGTASDILATVGSTLVTAVISMVAAALVTAVLSRIALGEATGRSVPAGQVTALLRRLALPAVGISLVIGALSSLALLIPAALGALPLIILQEAGWLTIISLLLGILLGVLAAVWVWARTALALPALAMEETGVIGSLRRALAMTAGRKLWRVLGLLVLLMLLVVIAQQVIGGVFGFAATIIYVAILLVTQFEAFVLAIMIMTVLAMAGSYIATFLLAPFLSAGYAAIYADHRMRHEAWDVELNRQARGADEVDGSGEAR